MGIKQIIGIIILIAAFGLGGWGGVELGGHFAAGTIKAQAKTIASLRASKTTWDRVTDNLTLQADKAKQAAQAQRVRAAQAGRALTATVDKTNAMRSSYDRRLVAAKADAVKAAKARCSIVQAVVPPQLMGY